VTKACVADVRSAGGLSNSCSLEGRDGEGREGRQKTMAGGREAVQESRAPTIRGGGAGRSGSWRSRPVRGTSQALSCTKIGSGEMCAKRMLPVRVGYCVVSGPSHA
jgi:hypothetical protein